MNYCMKCGQPLDGWSGHICSGMLPELPTTVTVTRPTYAPPHPEIERQAAEHSAQRSAWHEAGKALLAEKDQQADALRSELAALTRKLAEREADAERYRWLKANHLQTGPDSWIRTGDDLEEAIDAELRK